MSQQIAEKYRFENGKPYPSRAATSADDYLRSVLRAERFIAQHQRHSSVGEGIYWLSQVSDESLADPSFYGGTAGIAYFYLKLYETTGEERFKNIAQQALDYLVVHWKDLLNQPNPSLSFPIFSQGLYAGIAGIGLTFIEAYELFHDEQTKSALRDIVSYYQITARSTVLGAQWTGSVAVLLDGGILLFLLSVDESLPELNAKPLIAQAGKAYLAKGKAAENGGLQFDGFDGLADYSAPNFEFGTAGAGYVLLKLYQFTRDQQYLQGAYAAAEYLKQLRYPQKKGYLIPYHLNHDGTPITDNQGKPIFYLSLCHGPSATAKFYYELYKTDGDAANLEVISQLFDGLESLGAPEQESAGLWNCVTVCCGNAGLLHAFIGLYQATAEQRWLDLAKRTAATLLGWEETLDNGASDWPIAWERVHPDDFSRRIGYFDGAAGIALSLLELYLTEKNTYQWKRLVVDPFPERPVARPVAR